MSDQPPNSVHGAVDGAMKFGEKFGIPALLLCVYFGFDLGQQAGWIPNPMAKDIAEMKEEIQEIKGQGIQHDSTMKELTKAVESQGEQLEEEAKKRQIKCVVRAATPEERKACMTSKE